MRLSVIALAAALAAPAPIALAQDTAWLQIEAHRSLTEAEAAARGFAGARANVNGFTLGTGWYAIALGPYSPEDAAVLLRQLKSAGAIPGDAYISDGAIYRSRFWPHGATQETGPVRDLPGTGTAAASAPDDTPAPAAEPAPEPDPLRDPGETVAEARASEAELDRDAKRALQVALQWAGHYEGAIDGLYGRGTRNSMAAWQAANAYPETGVLTTAQRAELIAAYNAILDGMGLQVMQDDAAGIRMQIPAGVVAFEGYEPPFVRFAASGDLPAQVLLISQSGDAERLAGLYEIMQTLEIVPPEGPRARNGDRFTLEGLGDDLRSYTEAAVEDGQIKGFTLIWPAGDDARFARVLEEMRASFTRTDGVLDPAIAPPDDSQAADLVSGLEVRKPRLTRSGVYLDDAGTVLTVAEAVQDCGSIEVDGGIPAELRHSDDEIAVLTPQEPLSPQAHALFLDGMPRIQSRVALAGFPYDGVLTRAAMTFGTLDDIRDLTGNDARDRLTLTARPSEAGGPVFDNSGHVIGVLLPPVTPDGKQLPDDVAFSVDSRAILAALDAAGITAERGAQGPYRTEEQITEAAGQMTVLVRCWE